MRRALWLLLALAACDAPPPRDAPPDDAGRTPPNRVDATGLADGTVIYDDAAAPLPDAAVLTDAGRVCRSGSVSGVVCAPDQEQRIIVGAEVVAATRDCEGRPTTKTTVTDRAGKFALSGLAPGPTEVTIRAGNFLAAFQVEVFDGADVPIVDGPSRKVCLQSTSAKLAVLSGDYDRIQELVADLGFEHTVLCGDSGNSRSGRALLQDWDALRAHDVLFVNCATGIDLRSTNPETDRIIANLRRFVREGGSVYVSDLSADFVGRVWPDFVEWDYRPPPAREEPACCVCGADCAPECVNPQPGPSSGCDLPDEEPAECLGRPAISGHGQPQNVRALVNDENLRAYLDGGDTLEIRFPLGGWVEMLGVAEGVDVLVEGAPGTALEGRPLMVVFQPEAGGGRVAYTSFHNHDQANADMRAILAALIFRL